MGATWSFEVGAALLFQESIAVPFLLAPWVMVNASFHCPSMLYNGFFSSPILLNVARNEFFLPDSQPRPEKSMRETNPELETMAVDLSSSTNGEP